MPLRVREILSTVDFADFKKICNTLSQLETTFKEKQGNSYKIASQQSNQNERRSIENKANEYKGRDTRIPSGRGQQNYGNRENNMPNVISSNITMVPLSERIQNSAGFNFSDRYNLSLSDLSIPPPCYFTNNNQLPTVNHRDLNS